VNLDFDNVGTENMDKDLWIQKHEEAIAEYLDRFPSASWEHAYNVTGQAADAAYAEHYAAMIDEERMRQKEAV
jgi:hypothetical protein